LEDAIENKAHKKPLRRVMHHREVLAKEVLAATDRAMSPASARILAAAGPMPWTSIRLDPVAWTAASARPSWP
jgi:hypothetical protein